MRTAPSTRSGLATRLLAASAAMCLLRLALAVVGPEALGAGAAVPGPASEGVSATLEFDLDGSLEGRCGERTLTARLGRGGRFVAFPGGRGVEAGSEGPAVGVPVPDGMWRPAGTLTFQLRSSRTLRNSSGEPNRVVLVDCPLFRLTLSEERNLLKLAARAATAPDEAGKPGRPMKGQLFWSHLRAGKWYDLAFAWDARNGRVETYLNGAVQQQMRLGGARDTWEPPPSPRGELAIGGILGEGPDAARLAVRGVRLYPRFMGEAEVAEILKGRTFPLIGEGRWDIPGSLDLSPYKMALIYEADFTEPLDCIHEDDLFRDGERVRLPEGSDWVLEGEGKAWTEDGRVTVMSTGEGRAGNLVLWNTREFPEDFLLEFAMSPQESTVGLTILFFATRSLEGGSPFDPGLPWRAGDFPTYHTGTLNGYHISYWASTPADGGTPRRAANLRKNRGFFLAAAGIDRITGEGPGPHSVRLLKVGNKIRLETRGRLALTYDDDGKSYGAAWRDGWIGLRQMAHTRRLSYTHFRVWRVERKQDR